MLLYHCVAEPASDVYGLSIPPDVFRRQMRHVRDRCVPTPLADVAAAVCAGRALPGAVAVTFDDGYIDNLTTALPILEEFRIPATFFVTTAAWTDAGEYWWDVLEAVLLVPGPPAGRAVLELRVDGELRAFPIASSQDRRTTLEHLHALLLRASADQRDGVVAQLKRWHRGGRPPDHERRRMSAEEIKFLSKREGVSIGAHSRRHLFLPAQPAHVVAEEVAACKADLESLLGRPVAGFAYPFGAVDGRARSLVSRSFEFAVTCEPAPVTERSDRWALPRFEVRSDRISRLAPWIGDWRPGAQALARS